MELLLGFSRAVDWINQRVGWLASWCVLIACVISAANATSRHAFSIAGVSLRGPVFRPVLAGAYFLSIEFRKAASLRIRFIGIPDGAAIDAT